MTNMPEMPRDSFYFQRQQMVERQLAGRDITNEDVLEAMSIVPRHEFVPARLRPESYTDNPLSIGCEQTISQPYIVALMTQLAEVDKKSIVLEIGTGSGYQTAILSLLVYHVHTVEIVEPLQAHAEATLNRLGYKNISFKCGDGYHGWPEHAPYDAVIVTAAPLHVPQSLIDQLREGGRLIIPIGEKSQDLVKIVKHDYAVVKKSVIPVRFVPMTGEAEDDAP